MHAAAALGNGCRRDRDGRKAVPASDTLLPTLTTSTLERETPPHVGNQAPLKVDPSIPHSARLWNYWLGGKDNYNSDRAAGDEIAKRFPSIIDLAKADRAFLQRAVRFLVADQGIRQILDIGTGLPTANNTHEVAQSIAPESRIVYVDNDPLVLVHARALLTGDSAGPPTTSKPT